MNPECLSIPHIFSEKELKLEVKPKGTAPSVTPLKTAQKRCCRSLQMLIYLPFIFPALCSNVKIFQVELDKSADGDHQSDSDEFDHFYD